MKFRNSIITDTGIVIDQDAIVEIIEHDNDSDDRFEIIVDDGNVYRCNNYYPYSY